MHHKPIFMKSSFIYPSTEQKHQFQRNSLSFLLKRQLLLICFMQVWSLLLKLQPTTIGFCYKVQLNVHFNGTLSYFLSYVHT